MSRAQGVGELGNATVSSVSLPGKFNDEVERDLMFYKKHIIFHICGRFIRWSADRAMPDRAMRDILESYHYCLVIYDTAKVPCSDGEGALNNDAAKAILKDTVKYSKPLAGFDKDFLPNSRNWQMAARPTTNDTHDETDPSTSRHGSLDAAGSQPSKRGRKRILTSISRRSCITSSMRRRYHNAKIPLIAITVLLFMLLLRLRCQANADWYPRRATSEATRRLSLETG